jgi:DNA gyrase subunit A
VSEYRQQSRGGKGIITMKTNDKNGDVLGARQVLPTDDLMLVSNKGQMIRIHVGGISEQGRNTQGVRLMTVAMGEKVVSIEQMAENAPTETPEGGASGESATGAPPADNGSSGTVH